MKPDVAQSREGKSSFAAERIDGGKLRCTSWDDAVVIMPGEALVVNLDGRPTRCGPRCRALWYPRQAPDPGADDSRPLPRDAVGSRRPVPRPRHDAVQAPSDRAPLREGECAPGPPAPGTVVQGPGRRRIRARMIQGPSRGTRGKAVDLCRARAAV